MSLFLDQRDGLHELRLEGTRRGAHVQMQPVVDISRLSAMELYISAKRGVYRLDFSGVPNRDTNVSKVPNLIRIVLHPGEDVDLSSGIEVGTWHDLCESQP